MDHDKQRRARPVDLAAHMDQKRRKDAHRREWERIRSMWGMTTTTLDALPKKETERERNVREYVSGIIDHDEYERREGIRLSREDVSPLSETAA